MKNARWVLACCIPVILLSCDIIAPAPNGRWNSQDPKYEPTTDPDNVKIVLEADQAQIPNQGSYDFGSMMFNSESKSVTFTIRNTGKAALRLTGSPPIALGGVDASLFSVMAAPSSPIAGESSTTFTVKFTPVNAGDKRATLSIASSDPVNGAFSITLKGAGITARAPDIVIKQDTTTIDSGATVAFGTILVGANKETTFTVSNPGSAALSLSGNPLVAISGSGAFTVITQPSTSVPAGGSTTFTVRYAPTDESTVTSTFTLGTNVSGKATITANLAGNGTRQWVKTYTDPSAGTFWLTHLVSCSSGGYLCVGGEYPYNSFNSIVVRLDGNGNLLWQKGVDVRNNDSDGFNSIQEIQNGVFLIAGNSWSSGSSYASVSRMDIDGTFVWRKKLDNYGDAAIWKTSDGNAIFTARGSGGLLVIKLDIAGSISWSKNIPLTFESVDQVIRSMCETSDHGFLFSCSSVGTQNIAIRLDSSGNLVWAKRFLISGAISATTDGNFLCVGTFAATGGNDTAVMKLDGNGSILWQKSYGRAPDGMDNVFQETADGGYLICGTTDLYGAGNTDALVMKLDAATGAVVAQRCFGGSGSDSVDAFSANNLAKTSDGGFIICGTTGSYGTNPLGRDLSWILKLDGNGDIPGASFRSSASATATTLSSTSTTVSTTVTNASVAFTDVTWPESLFQITVGSLYP